MAIRADKRSIHARREAEAERCITEGLAELRAVQLRLARSFARIEASAHFALSGCASLVEYAAGFGYSALETRTLLGLGKTLGAADHGAADRGGVEDAEARVCSGELPIEAAAAVGRILGDPSRVSGPAGSPQAGWGASDWLDAAAKEPFRALQRRVKQHIEAHAQGETGIEEVTVFVTEKTKDAFGRAREVASQKAGKPLSEGQTFQRVVDFYLDKNDPLRSTGRARRVGPTSERPGDARDPSSRYVPASVRAAVWQRANGVCEVATCRHRMGLELAHRTPHAKGSAREVTDLGLLCHRHHLLYDAGRIAWPAGAGSLGAGSLGAGPAVDPPSSLRVPVPASTSTSAGAGARAGACVGGDPPKACSSGARPPDASLPDASLPDASLPDASLPDASLPDASMPDASMPDAGLPDASPGDAKPGNAKPGDANPRDANPGSANPGSANPGSANPGSANPGSAKPSSAGLADAHRMTPRTPPGAHDGCVVREAQVRIAPSRISACGSRRKPSVLDPRACPHPRRARSRSVPHP